MPLLPTHQGRQSTPTHLPQSILHWPMEYICIRTSRVAPGHGHRPGRQTMYRTRPICSQPNPNIWSSQRCFYLARRHNPRPHWMDEFHWRQDLQAMASTPSRTLPVHSLQVHSQPMGSGSCHHPPLHGPFPVDALLQHPTRTRCPRTMLTGGQRSSYQSISNFKVA
jgi:hypothetical protein